MMIIRLVIAITAALVAATFASSAEASVIVYSCGYRDVCAISPEGGAPRPLLRIPEHRDAFGGGSSVADPSITTDGKTFITVIRDTLDPLRIVTGPTDLKAPVTSSNDTSTLRDFRPPIPHDRSGRSYGEAVFGSDASRVLYSSYESGDTRAVTLATPSGDRVVYRGAGSGVFGRLGGNPAFYSAPGSNCLVLPAGECRPFAAGQVFAGGSPDGRYLLTGRVSVPGYTMVLRDAATLRPIRSYPNASGGDFSPDSRFITYTTVDDDNVNDNDVRHITVAPVDGSAPPRQLPSASGISPSWGGSLGSATSIAGASAPKLSAPKRVSRRSASRGVKLRVRAQRGATLRASLKVGRRVVATERGVAGARTKALRLKPSRKARKRLRGAKKLKATVKVGRTFTLTRTIRVR